MQHTSHFKILKVKLFKTLSLHTWKATGIPQKYNTCGPERGTTLASFLELTKHRLQQHKRHRGSLNQRCTSRAQRTVCDDVCCCAVHACTGWNSPARHVAGEGRAASAIGGEGERTLSVRDRWSACYGMVGGAGSTWPVRTLAQCTARVQESCSPLP
jgi:hypothetical protein